MNGKSDGLIPTVPILFVLLSIIVSFFFRPVSIIWMSREKADRYTMTEMITSVMYSL